MASREGRVSSRARGFATLNEERKKQIASQGGHASAKANTSNRGFASMDKNKQREISSMGGRASSATQHYRPERNEEDAEQKDIISEEDASVRDQNALHGPDNLESSRKTQGSLASSEADEDEGSGDGNLGRSTRKGVF